MTQTLDYLPLPQRDRLTRILMTATWILMLADPVAAAMFSMWHTGLRSIPVFADLQFKDVAATAILCGTPLVGILVAVCLIWRCGRSRRLGTVLGSSAVFFHTWNLWVWGRMEIWFWMT